MTKRPRSPEEEFIASDLGQALVTSAFVSGQPDLNELDGVAEAIVVIDPDVESTASSIIEAVETEALTPGEGVEFLYWLRDTVVATRDLREG